MCLGGMDLFVVGREVKECQESPLRMQGLSSPLSLSLFISLFKLSITSRDITTHGVFMCDYTRAENKHSS